MADSVTVKFRKIVQEDFAASATTNGETTAEVMGIGAGVTVHAFISAASDAAAAALNCQLGQIYYSTTLSALKARMT
jgi:ribose 5-phosphate isomerase